MSDGDVTLEAMIQALQKTPDALNDALPQMASAVKRALREANEAGVSPDGVPYQRTQQGLIPLRGGAKKLSVVVEGTTIIARLRGVEVLHTEGDARGHIVRSMLPEGDTPDALHRELERIAERNLREVLE